MRLILLSHSEKSCSHSLELRPDQTKTDHHPRYTHSHTDTHTRSLPPDLLPPPSRPDLSSSCLRPFFSLLSSSHPPTSTSSSSRPPLVVQSFVSRSVFRPERCLYKHPFCALCCHCCLLSTVSPLAQKFIRSNHHPLLLVPLFAPLCDRLLLAVTLYPAAPREVKNHIDRTAYEIPLAQYHKDTIHVVRLSRLPIRPRAVVSDPAHSTARPVLRHILRASLSLRPPRTCAYASESRNLPDRFGTPPTRITKAILVSANIFPAFSALHLCRTGS